MKFRDCIMGYERELALLMVYAFRYAKSQHETQALKGIEGVLMDNIELLNMDFIAQMINDIKFEQDVAEYKRRITCLQGLKNYIDSYEHWLAEKPEAKELHDLLIKVQECAKRTTIKSDSVLGTCDTEYMNSLLNKLEQELKMRG